VAIEGPPRGDEMAARFDEVGMIIEQIRQVMQGEGAYCPTKRQRHASWMRGGVSFQNLGRTEVIVQCRGTAEVAERY
jgi:hypothetical protein